MFDERLRTTKRSRVLPDDAMIVRAHLSQLGSCRLPVVLVEAHPWQTTHKLTLALLHDMHMFFVGSAMGQSQLGFLGVVEQEGILD